MPPDPTSELPVEAASGFFDAFAGSFEEAAAVRGSTQRDISIAGVPIRLRFAGEELLEGIFPPLEHASRGDAAPPVAEICVFEGARSGVAPPSLPWSATPSNGALNPIDRYRDERVTIIAEGALGLLTAGLLDGSRAVFYVSDPDRVPLPEWVGRLRPALMLALGPRSRRLLHAGAVGVGGRGALIAGRSGVGKSTLAVACAVAGMEICADDYFVLEPGDPPVAHALPSTANLSEASTRLLGLGDPPSQRFEQTIGPLAKASFDLRDAGSDRFVERLELGALLAPVRNGASEPALRPVSRGKGLQALAPSTVFQQLPTDEGLLPTIAALVAQLPCFEIELSADMEANAALVREVAERV